MSRKPSNRQHSNRPNVEPEAVRHAQPSWREETDEKASRPDRDLDTDEDTGESKDRDIGDGISSEDLEED